MNRIAFPLAVAALLSACGGNQPASGPTPSLPPVALRAVGDSVLYVEQTEAHTVIDRPGDTLLIQSNHTAVIHVVRTAPDTLEAYYEYLQLRFATPSQTRNVDTRALIGPRFVLHEDQGSIETVSAPELPDEIRQLTDLRRQFDDFFLRTHGRALAVGEEWTDTLVMGGTEGEAGSERRTLTRFRVRGDTALYGIPGRIIEYESTIEAHLRTAPTREGVLRSSLTGGENGTFVYSPERGVMLQRERVGVLEGEIVVEGNLETLRFPQSYSYESRVALIPPGQPALALPHTPVPPRTTPQP